MPECMQIMVEFDKRLLDNIIQALSQVNEIQFEHLFVMYASGFRKNIISAID
jgi:hypothetical protein